MSNIMLGYGNLISSATVAAGTSHANFPVANLKDRRLHKVWRSTNDDAASTVLNIDHGSSKTWQVIQFARHNLSQTATFRVRSDQTDVAVSPDHDSTTTNVWPVTYTTAQLALYPWYLTYVLPAPVTHRLIRIDLVDTSNPNNYVQGARLFVGPALQANMNTLTQGTGIGWRERSVVNETISGAKNYHRRPKPRFHRFTLDGMLQAEAMAFMDMIGISDITDEVVVIQDPATNTYALQNRWLASFRRLPSIEYPRYIEHQIAGEVEELLP